VKGLEQAPHIDVAGARNPSDGSISLFILNRDLTKSHDVEVMWEDQAPSKVLNASVLTGDDLKAVNSFQAPQKVAPQAFTKPPVSGTRTKFEVPARSYTVIQFGA
jgi:alpha-N-arabinofuranosidase